MFATDTPAQVVRATGRIWGFTPEVDSIERHIHRALSGKQVRFEVTRRSVIGSRGVFHKRTISKYEYQVVGSRRDVKLVGDLIGTLAGSLS